MKKCGVFRDSVVTVNFEKVLLCKSVTLFLKLDLVFKTRLKDQYLQTWTDDVASNAKCINYHMYKSDISLEFYITFLPMKLRTVFSIFRCRNHKLPVETGIYKNIPRSERVCVKCTQSETHSCDQRLSVTNDFFCLAEARSLVTGSTVLFSSNCLI